MATTQFRRYHYVLASESSDESGTDRTESVYSMQDKETEYVRDESDTCTKSDASEYTLNSIPTEDNILVESLSSATDEFIIRTEKIVVETRTMSSQSGEHEDSVASSDDSELGQADYWNCAQCHKANNHPKYRYCMKCFRLRKEMFPPKPKATKKRCSRGGNDRAGLQSRQKRKHSTSEHSSPEKDVKAMKMDRAFIQMGSIAPRLQKMSHAQTYADRCNEVEQIQAPKRLKESNEDSSQTLTGSLDAADQLKTNSLTCGSLIGKFGTLNTSSQTFNSLCENINKVHDVQTMESNQIADHVTNDVTSTSALCIMCDKAPKNGLFVHMYNGHACCCYLCALKVWKQTKKCPTCNLPASKVIKLIIS